MTSAQLKQWVVTLLEDLKAQKITVLDVSAMTDLTDYMIIASGTSNRHVRSMAQYIVTKIKEQNIALVGVEGEEAGDWVLVDLSDVVVHIMQAEARDFYQLEKLWQDINTPADSQ